MSPRRRATRELLLRDARDPDAELEIALPDDLQRLVDEVLAVTVDALASARMLRVRRRPRRAPDPRPPDGDDLALRAWVLRRRAAWRAEKLAGHAAPAWDAIVLGEVLFSPSRFVRWRKRHGLDPWPPGYEWPPAAKIDTPDTP